MTHMPLFGKHANYYALLQNCAHLSMQSTAIDIVYFILVSRNFAEFHKANNLSLKPASYFRIKFKCILMYCQLDPSKRQKKQDAI